LRNIKENTSTKLGEMIDVVENRSDLDYQEVSYDRRGFFNALKSLTVQGAAGFLEKVDREQTVQSYSTKALPLRRELLNRSFSFSPEGIRKEVLRSYYFDVTVDGICDHCSACVGVCPTGALKIGQNGSDRAPYFSTALCSGCGLCERFCRTHSISLQKGFSGDRPFGFDIAKKAPSYTLDSVAGRGFHLGGEKPLEEASV
jgi:ferredoxin